MLGMPFFRSYKSDSGRRLTDIAAADTVSVEVPIDTEALDTPAEVEAVTLPDSGTGFRKLSAMARARMASPVGSEASGKASQPSGKASQPSGKVSQLSGKPVPAPPAPTRVRAGTQPELHDKRGLPPLCNRVVPGTPAGELYTWGVGVYGQVSRLVLLPCDRLHSAGFSVYASAFLCV